jgi:phage terminase large subunit
LKDLIEKYNLSEFEVTNNSIVNKINGSDFIFKGLWNNEQSIKSIEGIDIAWVEEAQTVSKKSIDVLTPTVRKPGSQIIYTYNRLLEDDPIHTRLVIEGRPDTLVIHVNYDTAQKYGWIPEVVLKEIEDDKVKRPGAYKHKWLGEPNSSELRIYKDWQVIDEVPRHARLRRRALDYGYTNDPSALVDIYEYDGGWVIDEQLYQKGMLNSQLSDVILNLPDPQILVIGDSAEPKSIAEMKLSGINIIGAEKKAASSTKTETYIKWSIGLVQNQKVSVTKRSINTWKEYTSYIWMVDKDGKILNEEDQKCANHSMAAIRYGLVSLVRDPVFVMPTQSLPTSNYYPDLGI